MPTSVLELETDVWKLSVVGNLPGLPEYLDFAVSTTIELMGAGTLRAYDPSSQQLVERVPATPISPILYENINYDFYLESRQGLSKLKLPAAAGFRYETKGIQHYAINFRNDVGFVDIQVENEITGITNLRLEVFPLKLDYRSDYIQMRDEVAAVTRNLVIAAQARTFGQGSATRAKQPTLVEWLSLMRGHFAEFIDSARAISRNPYSQLRKSSHEIQTQKSRKVDHKRLSKLIRTGFRRGVKTANDVLLPERVPGLLNQITFDTVENRYVKALLFETERKLQRIIRTHSSGDEDADMTAEEKFFEAARPDAATMLKHLKVFLRAPFLSEVASVPPRRPLSMVFHQHPQYASFVRAAQLLNGGLAVIGGPLQVGLKQISLLYEYWCFLRLIALLSERFDLEQQTIVKVKHLRIVVVLAKGVESVVRFKDSETQKSLLVIYNRLFSRLPTVNQQPDNIIELASQDGFHIFDAKYRLSFDPRYIAQYGGVGPTIEDINTMHRYRDAIVIPTSLDERRFKNIVNGAVVFFPFQNEEEYGKHKFYRSVETRQIGGLPFLPSAVNLVQQHLRQLLASSGYHV
ncbi:MAG TPA: DUF2357 domain-containing protein [Pyrinomonadaceae bacterium]